MSDDWYVCDTQHATQEDMAACCPTTRVKKFPPEKGKSPRKSVREAHREHIQRMTTRRRGKK